MESRRLPSAMHLFPSREHLFNEGLFVGVDRNKVRRILKSKRVLIVWMALGLLLLGLAILEQETRRKPQTPERAQRPLNTRA